MLPIHTILFPTDFSPSSKSAFSLASALARDYSARLIVLHVVEPPILAYSGVMAAPPPPDLTGQERESLLKKLRAIEPDAPKISVEHLLIEGEPTAAILKICQERKCDLVVMGSHGRTGLYRLVLGSVAEHVLRKANCPVLIAKSPSAANGAAQAASTAELAKR